MTNQDIITGLFEIKAQAHHLHHITSSFSEHKALGQFYETWDDLSDKFIETYQGKLEKNIEGNFLLNVKSDLDCLLLMTESKEFISNIINFVSGPDLDNILADMLILCNHTSYLLTLK